MTAEFSVKEAAAILHVPERFVRKAIEAGTVTPRLSAAGRAPRYRLRADDLLLLKLLAGFPFSLRRQDARALRDLISNHRGSSGCWQVSGADVAIESATLRLVVPMEDVRGALARDIEAFLAGRARVAEDPAILGGEPVFSGTRIPVAHIAGLTARGVPWDEIAEDYPSLRREDIAYAAVAGRMKPDPGRPRKRLQLVRGARPMRGSAQTTNVAHAGGVTPTRARAAPHR